MQHQLKYLYYIDQTFTNKQVTGIKITSGTSHISNTLLQEITKNMLADPFLTTISLGYFFVLSIINSH